MCPVVKSISGAEQSCVTGMSVSPLSSKFCTVQLLEGLINLSALRKREASSFQGLFHIMLLTPELQMLHTCDTCGRALSAAVAFLQQRKLRLPLCSNKSRPFHLHHCSGETGRWGTIVCSDCKFDKDYYT